MRFKIDSIAKEQAYQNTACMVLMKAIVETFGMDVNVRVGNSLNQGFFIYVGDTDSRIGNSDFGKIEKKMAVLIEADLPINNEIMTNAEAIELWKAYDVPEKVKLLEGCDPDENITISELDGYRNCFYGCSVMSGNADFSIGNSAIEELGDTKNSTDETNAIMSSNMLRSTGYIELYDVRRYRNGLLLRIPNMLSPASIPEYRDDDKLYDAFAESKRVRKTTGVDYLADLNRINEDGVMSELIAETERMQQHEIDRLAETIIEDGRRIVLIAGPSSSGKTTFAKRLCTAISDRSDEPIYMGTDDYFVEREMTPLGEDGQPDFEGFACLDIELFNKQMTALLNGEAIDAPEFDFVKGTKVFGKRSITARPGQTIVIEGIHSLNDELTKDIPQEWKFRIYISPLTRIGIDRHNRLSTTDARMLRRMVRDYNFRGHSVADTIRDWRKVREGENRNIFPYSNSADYIFNSSLVYETSLMKTYAEPLLLSVSEAVPEYADAQRLLCLLKYFDSIDSEAIDAVPDYSLLREFIGKR